MAAAGTDLFFDGQTDSTYYDMHKEREQEKFRRLLETRKPLREDIQKLIAPYRDHQLPPFSPEELIIMAIIDSDSKYATRSNILQWILKNFSIYKDKAVSSMLKWFDHDSEVQLQDVLCGLHKRFDTAFNDYRLDLTRNIADIGQDSYTVDVNSARIYLQRWIGLEREGSFRFLDLPAELQEHALILIDSNRESLINGYWPDWDHKYVDSKEILSIAATCKQVANEAIPIFYGGNTFLFGNSIVKFVKETTSERIRHLKTLRLYTDIYKTTCANDPSRSALESVSDAVSLDELTIIVRTKEYASCWSSSCVHDKWGSVADIPFVQAVPRLACKAKKVKIVYESNADQNIFEDVRDCIVKEVDRLNGPKIQELQHPKETEETWV